MKIRSSAWSLGTNRFAKFCVLVCLQLSSLLSYADSPMLVDAAGRAVGYLVDDPGICNSASTRPVYSFNGYLACFLDTGKADYSLQPPGTFGPWQGGFFTTTDCSGEFTQYATQAAGQTLGGYVVATSQGLMGGESPEDADIMDPFISSTWVGDPSDGTCVEYPMPIHYTTASLLFPAWRLEAFNLSPYLPPFTVQSLPNIALLDVIFFDSLDVEY